MKQKKVCISLIKVIQEMEKKQKAINNAFESNRGFEVILYSPYIGELMNVLIEVLALPEIPQELKEEYGDEFYRVYMYDVINDYEKSPEEIYEEIRKEIKDYLEEDYQEDYKPSVKENFEKNKLMQIKEHMAAISKIEKKAIDTAIELLEELKGRKLNELEEKRLMKFLKDKEIKPEELEEKI